MPALTDDFKIAAFSNQPNEAIASAIQRGMHGRTESMGVQGVAVSPVGRQHFRMIEMSLLTGRHQRREPRFVRPIRVASAMEQQSNRLGIVAVDRIDQILRSRKSPLFKTERSRPAIDHTEISHIPLYLNHERMMRQLGQSTPIARFFTWSPMGNTRTPTLRAWPEPLCL